MRLEFRNRLFREKIFKEYALKCALVSLFAWLAIGLYIENLVQSLVLGIAAGLVLLGLLLYMPAMQSKKHAQLVESQLPFALMNMAVELNLGIRFEEILEHAEAQGNEIGKEFGRVLAEVREQGSSVQNSLMHFAERVDSLEVKRAIALFVSVYEQGQKRSGESVKMLARELLHKQRSDAKEFSGKLVVYSLLFVAVSAVVPALFQSFVIVGSMVLRLTFTAEQAFLAIVVGFPAVDVIVLYYIRAKTPVFLRA